jgi:fructose-1,6-bisphosphatase
MVLETVNKFGDVQLQLDVHCDELIEKHLRQNPLVRGLASEERPEYLAISDEEGGYDVTYDPLDGSSIVDTNFSVGSIFSIWPHDKNKIIGTKLKNQANAILAVYGPRTTAFLYNPEVDKVQ